VLGQAQVAPLVVADHGVGGEMPAPACLILSVLAQPHSALANLMPWS
jgi:hypothetical protein